MFLGHPSHKNMRRGQRLSHSARATTALGVNENCGIRAHLKFMSRAMASWLLVEAVVKFLSKPSFHMWPIVTLK